ncbi:MAG TPA: acylphosphatase [Sedimenticola thiotaurini]|uniref:acylphosphatase n=1 Tax=Sedimenticola thiotaurini TaxID=1543721 RepID=A0A831RJ22_9GAMM|nr:acylphosphatase [Sedimenticola thiotaurini]
MTICIRCLVSGRVQGVFFRASARHQAQSLGITGHARNLPDGRVEVLACGTPEAVDQFKAWLTRGPDGARVDNLACETVDEQRLSGFSVG